MNLVLTTLLGAASAVSVMEISGSYGTSNGYLDVSLPYSFELVYQTVYGTGQMSNDDSILYESYGLNFYGMGDLGLEIEVLGVYTYEARLCLTLFDITPYRQFIQWVNPVALATGAATEFDVGVRGEYDLYFMKFMLEHHQTMSEFSYDVADWISGMLAGTSTVSDLIPTSSNWAASDDFEFDSIVVMMDPLMMGMDPSGTWYGTQAYFQSSLSGYITANV